MNANDVLELVKAGFSKAEIMVLAGAQAPAPAPEAEVPSVPETVTEAPSAPAQAPAPVAEAPKPNTVTLTEEQLQRLMQGVAVKASSASIEVPHTLDDTLTAHLENILRGE